MRQYNYLTIKLENIIPSTFEEWKTLIEPYISRYSIILNADNQLSDTMLNVCYNIIYDNFLKRYIRFQTPEAFWRGVAQGLVNYLPRWKALVDWIQLEYKMEYNKIIGGGTSETRIQTTSASDTVEAAATPATTVTAEMIEDYIDSKTTSSGNTNLNESIERTNFFDALSKIEQIENIHDMLLTEIRGTFAKYFMQISLEDEIYGNL